MLTTWVTVVAETKSSSDYFNDGGKTKMALAMCNCGKIGKLGEEVHEILKSSDDNKSVTMIDFMCDECFNEYRIRFIETKNKYEQK